MSAPSPQPELDPIVAERHEFMRGEGSILYTATNLRMLDEVAVTPLEAVRGTTYTSSVANLIAAPEAEGITRSNAGMHLATRAILLSNPVISTSMRMPHLRSMLGVTAEDQKMIEGKNTFRDGLEDRPFPWYFSAGLASVAVQAMVQDKKIDAEQAANLGLRDWANIIGSGWFGRLVHSMAFTHNSVFQGFGDEINDYEQGRLARKLATTILKSLQLGAKPLERVVDTNYEREPISGDIYITASIAPYARQLLRSVMRHSMVVQEVKRDSVGCPVARKVVSLPKDAPDRNPHIKFLEERGIIEIKPGRDDSTIQTEQNLTAIDRTLMLHAELLDRYDQQYGMPQPTSYRSVRHVEMPETRALVISS